MNQFLDMLDVHHEWLTLKGYDRQSLGLTRLQEDVLTQLKDKFAIHVAKDLYTKKPVDFYITVTGNLKRQQAVRFLFYYRYTPKPIRLNLLFLRAKLNETVQTWFITRDQQHLLPTSEKALEELRKMAAGQPRKQPKKQANRSGRRRTSPRL